MKVLHVITGLQSGGAETMLLKLLTRMTGEGPSAPLPASGTPEVPESTEATESSVVSLAEEGPLAAPIRALGIPVTCLGLSGVSGLVPGVFRLARLIRSTRPDLVQSWMYHADFMALAAARIAGWSMGRSLPVLWNLRTSNHDSLRSNPSTVRLAKALARLSRCPARIVCVSCSAREAHAALGYDPARMVVIPNGFDLDRFRPDAAAGVALRQSLGIAARTPVIGMVARFDPMKDHAGLLAALSRLRRDSDGPPPFALVLVGEGMTASNPALVACIADHRLDGMVHCLGRREDMAALTAGFDLAVSASAFGEGFSNAIGEALASGVPVVATDVGDARRIVGDAGRIVPPEDPQALAAALSEMLAMEPRARQALGLKGRESMASSYGIAAIARAYHDLYSEVLASCAPRAKAA